MKLIDPRFSVTQDGTTINIYHPDKGEGLPRHEHTYSHLTMCHAGTIIIRKEKGQMVLKKGAQPISLMAGEWHEIEALEDGTVFVNIFAGA